MALHTKRYWLVCIAVFCAILAKGQNLNNKGCDENCCPLDKTPAGVMISHVHNQSEWMFSYRYMNMSMGQMINGSSTLSQESIFSNYLMSSSKMTMHMHMLMAMYGISDRFTLMAMGHYNSTSMNMEAMPGTVHHHGGYTSSSDLNMCSSGFGDTKIQGLFALLKNDNHQLIAVGGISIPTGSIYQKGATNSMYSEERFPYAMQLGSGSWDVLPALSYLYQNGNFAYSAQISGTLRSTNNALNYKLGNEAAFTSWAAYKWCRFISNSLRVEGSASGYIKGQDANLYYGFEPAANPYNYGGKRVLTYLGFNFYFPPGTFQNMRLGAEYGIPIYQYLNGPQMKTKHTLATSISIAF